MAAAIVVDHSHAGSAAPVSRSPRAVSATASTCWRAMTMNASSPASTRPGATTASARGDAPGPAGADGEHDAGGDDHVQQRRAARRRRRRTAGRRAAGRRPRSARAATATTAGHDDGAATESGARRPVHLHRGDGETGADRVEVRRQPREGAERRGPAAGDEHGAHDEAGDDGARRRAASSSAGRGPGAPDAASARSTSGSSTTVMARTVSTGPDAEPEHRRAPRVAEQHEGRQQRAVATRRVDGDQVDDDDGDPHGVQRHQPPPQVRPPRDRWPAVDDAAHRRRGDDGDAEDEQDDRRHVGPGQQRAADAMEAIRSRRRPGRPAVRRRRRAATAAGRISLPDDAPAVSPPARLVAVDSVAMGGVLTTAVTVDEGLRAPRASRRPPPSGDPAQGTPVASAPVSAVEWARVSPGPARRRDRSGRRRGRRCG